MFCHRYSAERNTFYTVLVVAAVVLGIELRYFERDVVEEEVPSLGTSGEGTG